MKAIFFLKRALILALALVALVVVVPACKGGMSGMSTNPKVAACRSGCDAAKDQCVEKCAEEANKDACAVACGVTRDKCRKECN